MPGDIVVIASGQRVPADLRLIEIHSLRIGEALLTGESLSVEKLVAPVDRDNPLSDRFSMAYSGTLLTNGQDTGVVTATGAATENGRISMLLGRWRN